MKNGFSLIELMIVICIVGILAAVIVPAYQDALHKSDARAQIQCEETCKKACPQTALQPSTQIGD